MALPRPKQPQKRAPLPLLTNVEDLETVYDVDIRLTALVIVKNQADERHDVDEFNRVKCEIDQCLKRRWQLMGQEETA